MPPSPIAGQSCPKGIASSNDPILDKEIPLPFDRHGKSSRSSPSALQYCSGDVSADDADLLVNTVNCVNVMGKGVALAFKQRFPSIMPAYGAACRTKSLRPGGCLILPLPDGRKWAALATKDHWRDRAQLDWVRSGLAELASKAGAAGIRSIAIPPPGCTNGGLAWRDVEPIIVELLKDFDLRIYASPSGAI